MTKEIIKRAKKKIKKVMLIYPPIKISRYSNRPCFSPLGILYIAAVLRGAGYDVKVLDAVVEDYNHQEKIDNRFIYYGMPFERIKQKIEGYSPDVVGVSCHFSASFQAVQKICGMAKEIDKNIITLTGGAHPTFLAKECMENSCVIDFILLGESDFTTRDLLNTLNSNKDLKDVDGLAHREKGKIKINPKLKLIGDLDALPYPARELVPMEKYLKINAPQGMDAKRRENASLITSRGCPAKCIFCSSSKFWGSIYRGRSDENVLDEIEMLVREYGIREIQFLDDNLTSDKERAKNIFQGIIDRKLDIIWSTPNGIALWTLDEEFLRLMKKSGCYSLTLAIENGNQDFLSNFIKKPLNLKKAEELIRIIKKMGIKTHALFLIGFPEETKEQIKNTLRFARKIDVDSTNFFIPSPLPGTELYDICKKKGYLKKEFSFENLAFDTANYNPKAFPSKELEKLITWEFLKYNLSFAVRNPKRFIRKFGTIIIKNPYNSINLIKNLLWRCITYQKNNLRIMLK